MKEIKPVFKDLCATELLKRCLGAHTQNANESFNKRVWAICPKISNSVHKVVRIAAYDAAGTFNDGYINKLNIFIRCEYWKICSTVSRLSRYYTCKIRGKEETAVNKEGQKDHDRLRMEEHSRHVDRESTTYAAGAI